MKRVPINGELERLKHVPIGGESRSREKEILVLIENLLVQAEIFWLQRGRVNWLLHGDRNTSFFHNAATTRKKGTILEDFWMILGFGNKEMI